MIGWRRQQSSQYSLNWLGRLCAWLQDFAHLHRFQQDSSSVLEEASSTWLKGEMTPWASGSPRGRPRGQSRGTLAASVTSEEGDEQEAAEEELREEQAATLVQSLQQLEQVVLAGESLCRSVNSLPPYQDTLHPPASLHTASKTPVNCLSTMRIYTCSPTGV